MNITQNCVVELKYNVKTDNGQVLDSGAEPLFYLHGGYYGIFPAVEEILDGKSVGESIEVVLSPDAHFYGDYDPDLIHDVPREQVPEDSEVGILLEAINPETNTTHLMTILEIGDEFVKVDANHPLAGKTLVFQATVQSVREATPEEVAHGHVHGHDGEHQH